VSPALSSLFDADVPTGFQYRDDFITSDEEASLAAAIAEVEFSTFEMRGVVARRLVAFFGKSYDSWNTSAPPLPAFLLPLRGRVAAWAGVDAHAFAMALINKYSPGRADWLAPRRASVRADCRHFPHVFLSHEVSPVHAAACACVNQRSPANGHSRDLRESAIGVLDDRRIEERIRAPHSCGGYIALFDYVPDAAILTAPSSSASSCRTTPNDLLCLV
jgi:hypothetical protein